MAEQKVLTGSILPIEIAPGGYTLQAPDLQGKVTVMSAVESATRSDSGLYEDRLQEALRKVEILNPKVFEIQVTADTWPPSPAGEVRAGGLSTTTRDNEPAIVLRVPNLGDNVEQAVLYTDEAGVSSWIFPENGGGATPTATRGGGGEVVFHLPRNSAPIPSAAADESGTRGPISKLGRRLVRVLVWATDDIVRKGALTVATHWETKKRPYGLNCFPAVNGDCSIGWDSINQERALLLIHGTFSTALSAFGHLPQTTLEHLAQLYGGRILAFDHPSLHVSPQQNAQKLLDLLPADVELDILTHSRGGLVGRELCERMGELNRARRNIKIHKAIFVAAPHRGTILANADHGIEMLDRYTNLLTDLPDNAYTLTMEGILTVVKLLLHGALKALPGLQGMDPKGEYMRRLNTSPPVTDTKYYAAAADFTPKAEGLLARFKRKVVDSLIDGIFEEGNDGVVPTSGSYECGPNSPGFPIPPERRIIFEKDDQIHHCNFFTSEKLNGQIVEWLAQ